jgi:hypothetical protein
LIDGVVLRGGALRDIHDPLFYLQRGPAQVVPDQVDLRHIHRGIFFVIAKNAPSPISIINAAMATIVIGRLSARIHTPASPPNRQMLQPAVPRALGGPHRD